MFLTLPRMTGDQEFVSGSSLTQDAAEILYNLAAEAHLTVESQNADISEHRSDTGWYIG